jgi:serine/threonine protein kinase
MQVGSYTLKDRLGAGSMGIVFRALNPSQNPVAVKMIGSVAQVEATVYAGHQVKNAPALDVSRRMMFVREARVAMGLNHRNIARVFDYGQHNGLLYIVMELLEGRSLDKVIRFRSAIPIEQKLSMIRQLCEALSYAHQQGIIHRDIKAANCFVLRDLGLKVLDFGIAARMQEDGGTEALAGTYTHMAPELFAPVPHYTEQTDIWAAGITFYHLLTGALPFTGRSFLELVWNIKNSPYSPVPDVFPNVEELTRILDRCLDQDPARRFASAREFADALRIVEKNDGKPTTREVACVDPSGEPPSSGEEAAEARFAPVSSGLTVSVISRSPTRRSLGAAGRFVLYKEKVAPVVLIGSFFALSYAAFCIAGGDGFSSGPRFVWTLAGYASGFVVPAVLVLGVLLAGPVVREMIARIPECPRCGMALKHRNRVTTYASHLGSSRFAVSDCLAALKENLWEDAAKLLSMHGESSPPTFDRKSLYGPQRFHLDLYHCRCGHETALLNRESLVRKTWIPGDEIGRVHRSQGSTEIRVKPLLRAGAWINAIGRTLRPVTVPLPLSMLSVVVAAGMVITFYYYPQFPIILGWKNYRVPIVVQSNPPGSVCSVGSSTHDFTTPHTFRWDYVSDHEVSCVDVFYENGNIYKFAGLLPRSAKLFNDRSGHPVVPLHNFAIRADVSKDRWGRLTVNPITPVYTVKYVVAGKYDFVAEARDQLDAIEKKRAQEKAVQLTPVFGNGRYPAIRVTSIPPGLTVVVDGVRVVTPIIYIWELGSYHTLEVPVERQECCPGKRAGSRFYSAGRWDFGSKEQSNRVHINWSAIPFPSTYTARFQPEINPGTIQTAGEKTSGEQPRP